MVAWPIYAHIPDVNRTKLDEKLRFVGYSTQSKGYRLLSEKTSSVIIRRDVIFNETDFSCKKVAQAQQRKSVEFNNRSVEDVEPEVEQVEECRRYPERQRCPPVRFGLDEYADTVVTECLDNNQINEPSTIEEALKSDFAEEWKWAADAEYQSLVENETWELVELPCNRKPIGYKWVFKAKRGGDGKVERFKARLVAKGYAQKYGVDYDETFSPVVRFSSIRTLLAFKDSVIFVITCA